MLLRAMTMGCVSPRVLKSLRNRQGECFLSEYHFGISGRRTLRRKFDYNTPALKVQAPRDFRMSDENLARPNGRLSAGRHAGYFQCPRRSKPLITADSMTSSGGACPVHRSNASAPCPTSILTPSMVGHPRRAASCKSRVLIGL
jgi:hypothetical protein